MAADRIIGPAEWVGNAGRTRVNLEVFTESNEGENFATPIPTLQINFSNNDIRPYNLSSGANTITIPSNTTMVIIIMPDGNNQTCTLKGISGDTGIALNLEGVNILTLSEASPPSTIILAAGGTITGVKVVCK